MELLITNGRGYVGSDKNKGLDSSIDAIAVDSIYTPVERVNLTVQNTRVGQVTDYDKLTLDVFTMVHWHQMRQSALQQRCSVSI